MPVGAKRLGVHGNALSGRLADGEADLAVSPTPCRMRRRGAGGSKQSFSAAEGRATVSRKVWLGGAFLAVLVAEASTASAQQSEDWNRCVNRKDTYSGDEQIKACTALIRSGQENKRNTAIAFNNRGIAYYGKEDYDNAISDVTEAVNLDPSYADAFQSRASTYSDKGDHEHAIEDYNQSIRLNQKNPIAFNNRCDERLLIGQVQPAISDCNEALRQRP